MWIPPDARQFYVTGATPSGPVARFACLRHPIRWIRAWHVGVLEGMVLVPEGGPRWRTTHLCWFQASRDDERVGVDPATVDEALVQCMVERKCRFDSSVGVAQNRVPIQESPAGSCVVPSV